MNAYIITLREWFNALAPRERIIVAVGAVLVGATLVYLAAWEPLAKAHQRNQQALSAARTLGQKLEIAAAEVQNARGSGTALASNGTSLLTAVDQASKTGTLGKPLTRIQPEGDVEVKVWIDGVSFDTLLRWISELENRYGISAQTVDIEKDAVAGQVNARLSLVRP